MAREPNSIVISCSMDLSRSTESWQPIVTLRTDLRSEQGLLDTLWDSLGLLRIYTKKRGDVGLPRKQGQISHCRSRQTSRTPSACDRGAQSRTWLARSTSRWWTISSTPWCGAGQAAFRPSPVSAPHYAKETLTITLSESRLDASAHGRRCAIHCNEMIVPVTLQRIATANVVALLGLLRRVSRS
jgi:hypothetical protein